MSKIEWISYKRDAKKYKRAYVIGIGYYIGYKDYDEYKHEIRIGFVIGDIRIKFGKYQEYPKCM